MNGRLHTVCKITSNGLGVVVESVEWRISMQKVKTLSPVESNQWLPKVMLQSTDYSLQTTVSLVLNIIRLDKDWLAQYLDNITEWEIRS